MPRTVQIALIVLLGLLASGCVHEAGRGGLSHSRAPEAGKFKTASPPGRHPLPVARDEKTELSERLEYAFEYALDYGLTCALSDTLQAPVEQVKRNPLRCGLRATFEDALEWGLRHALDTDQKAAPPEALQAARQKALAYARAESLPRAIEAALRDNPEAAAAGDALRNPLLKALSNCIDESLDMALDNALHGEAETVVAEGPFMWPINHPGAYITSTFGSYARTRGGNGHMHAGVDIIVAKGVPVLAAASGTITFAGESGSGYGNLIKVAHGDGMETWYAHLDAFAVHEGEMVSGGTQIGEVGRTGRASGPHLHYEVHKHGHPIDPKPFLP